MLTKENTGLIIIDIQGKLAQIVHDSENILANSVKLAKGAQTLGLPILWLEQNPERLGPSIPELQEALTGTNQPIPKLSFSACKEKAVIEQLRNTKVDTWLICGIETHICVYQTALHIMQMGFKAEVVCDCVSSRTVFNKELALSKMQAEGIGLTSLEMCLYEMVGDCKAEEFKDILRLIK